jgi:cell division protein FtsI/penicillin-binding protein 2
MIRVKNYKGRKENPNKLNKNNRLQVLAAIVFLFAGVLVVRLITLQILKYDYYVALAASQHEVNNELKAKRGRIFYQDKGANGAYSLYPVATNKDFATVYAVPAKLKDPRSASEGLYALFDEGSVKSEVELLLKRDPELLPLYLDSDKKDESASGTVPSLSAEELKGLETVRDSRRDELLKTKREEKISAYMSRLDKPNDPYEPIKRKVDEETLAKIIAIDPEAFEYFYEKHRYYPEKEMGAHMLGFVGYQGDSEAGRYGLEGFFDAELAGKTGTLKTERAATGKLIIINDRQFEAARDGSDIILTIDRSIQFEVCKRLNEDVWKYGADAGTIIVMNPDTGAIISMCSWPNYDPNEYSKVENINYYNNPAIFDSYEPGSIFKAVTLAAAIDAGKITPDTTYQDNGFRMISGWDKPIKNSDYETHGGHGVVDMKTVLELSLNTGTIFAEEKLGTEKFAEYVKNFGFGEKTGIELETEGVSNISNLLRKTIRPIEAATASFGQGITATPLQMITAYSAIVNGGILMKPYLVSEIVSPDGTSSKTQPQALRRVISEKTAYLVSGMLVNVVDRGHSTKAQVPGYYVGGKTGTAQVAGKGGYSNKTIHTFIGFAPAEDPKFVMLVKLDNPKSVRFADSSTAPLFGDLASYILNYYQVEKEREEE